MPYFDQKVRFGKTPVSGFVLEATATDLASPVEGLTEYRSDTKVARIYLNSAWVRLDAGGSSPLGHTHASSEIISGVIDLARLGTTPAGGDFLKAIGATGSADWVPASQVKTDLALTKGDVGLGNVPNIDTTNASNITTGTLPTAVLPPLAINEVFTASSQAAMLALNAQRGDMCIRTDNGKTYVLSTDSPGTLADWKEVMATGQVVSVAGKTGVVTLVKADVGLDQVDNTSDANKPISSATAGALANKAPLTHSHPIGDLPVAPSGTSNTTQVVRADDSRLSDARTPAAHNHAGTEITSGIIGQDRLGTTPAVGDYLKVVSGSPSTANWTDPATMKSDLALTKGDVGLGNVDNTSDVNKPVSNATMTALGGKEPTINSPGSTAYYWRGDKNWASLTAAAAGAAAVTHATTHQPGGADAMAVDAAAATGSLRTVGTGALQAAAGNHTHTSMAKATAISSPALTPNVWTTVTHSLNIASVLVQVRETTSNEAVVIDWRPKAADPNAVEIRSAQAVAAGFFIVTVEGS